MDLDERMALVGHALADYPQILLETTAAQFRWIKSEHGYPASQGTYYEDVERWRDRFLAQRKRRRTKAIVALELELDRALADDERAPEPVSKIAKALVDIDGPVPQDPGTMATKVNAYDSERQQWDEDRV